MLDTIRVSPPIRRRHLGLAEGTGAYVEGPHTAYLELPIVEARADGKKASLKKIPADSNVILYTPTMLKLNHARVSLAVNQELARRGLILSFQSMLEPGDDGQVVCFARSTREVDISDVKWLFRLYVSIY